MPMKGVTLPLVALLENCACILFKLTVIPLLLRILYCVFTKSNVVKSRFPSTAVTTLLCVYLLGSAASLSYNVYLVADWHNSGNQYNVYVVYWTGLFQ
ncbi:hypothetical protein AAVH_06358 [Aphelenchoides avenae]|nr:hypothetical protein AAVH_06358 [Aphelenchus avenae]